MSRPGSTARDRTTAAPVETVELERVLGELLDASSDRVDVLHRRPFPYQSKHPLEELTVRREGSDEYRLVFKDLGVVATGGPAYDPGVPSLHDPRREIDTYRRVLAPEAIPAPRCIGAEVDPDRGRYWLFLERLEGDVLWQVGDPGAWRRAAAWLAELHGRFAGRSPDLPGRLLALDRDYFRCWLRRAERFVPWPANAAPRGRDFDWLAARVERVLDWLAGQPATFLHGEFYPSNVLVQRADGVDTGSDQEGVGIWPVDWEMAASGSGALDLAALLSGDWTDRERAELAEAYRLALPESSRPSAGELRADLDRCRLLVAVQWLGWAPHWDAPPEHRHDWLATALELAERTDLGPRGRSDVVHRDRSDSEGHCRGDVGRNRSEVDQPGRGDAGQRIEVPTVRRLNWGCGGAGAPGWTNSDRRKGQDIDIVVDIREGLPVDDASFDYVVSIHALPEVPYPDLVPVLEELRRILVPGGVLRLGLPDLERAMRAYLDGDRSYFLVPDEDARTLGGKLVTQVVWYGYARTPFTFDFIVELLESAGFDSVSRCPFGVTTSRFPGIVELDNREPESLFVEAVR